MFVLIYFILCFPASSTAFGSEPPPFDSPMMGQPPESDVVLETGPDCSQLTTDWTSIYVCALLSFCSSVQFSLYFSSMWQYFLILDKKATETFFGYIVAVYSLGQLFGSPIVGYISNRMRKIRHLLYAGLLLMFIGNAFYLVTHLFSIPKRKYILLIARFITGIGSSNICLLKAYSSSASTQPDRSRAIAFVTGGVALGMTMGPAFQLLFTPIGYPGFQYPGSKILRISMYTAPAILACAINLFNAIFIYKLFREIYAGVISVRLKAQNNGQTPQYTLPSPDLKAMLLCYITRFTQMFIHTNLETLGSPLAMMMFAWTKDESVKYFSIAGIMSFLAFLTYIAFILFRIDKIINFRLNLVLSLFALILFHALTYQYPFLPGHVETYVPSNGSSKEEQVGCDRIRFSWCDSVRPLSPIYFYICYILFIGIAFPNINVTLNTLFSQIIGPRRQGTQQGFLQMSGGMARMVGPVAISLLYSEYGPNISWMAEVAITAITLALWFLLYQRMVPLSIPVDLLGIETGGNSLEGGKSSTGKKSKRRRNLEERKLLVEPIQEEEEEDGQVDEEEEKEEEDEYGNRLIPKLERNNVTVSTVVSLGE